MTHLRMNHYAGGWQQSLHKAKIQRGLQATKYWATRGDHRENHHNLILFRKPERWLWYNIIFRSNHTQMNRFQRHPAPPLMPYLQPQRRQQQQPQLGKWDIHYISTDKAKFVLSRSRSVLEYVPAEYFRGESSLYGPPTMSVYCASRLVRCLLQ